MTIAAPADLTSISRTEVPNLSSWELLLSMLCWGFGLFLLPVRL